MTNEIERYFERVNREHEFNEYMKVSEQIGQSAARECVQSTEPGQMPPAVPAPEDAGTPDAGQGVWAEFSRQLSHALQDRASGI